ncbi:MAG: hypothetical protein ACKV22_13300 [Bryobacteraceae bacterium]
MTCAQTGDTTTEQTNSVRFNLIIHGMVAILEREAGIKILIPPIYDHVLRVGGRCGTIGLEFAAAEHVFNGLRGGKARFDPLKNVKLIRPTIDRKVAAEWRTVVIPSLPLEIHSLRTVPRGADSIEVTGRSAGEVIAKEFGMVHVLVWELANPGGFGLTNLKEWQAAINFHLYSEEPGAATPGHAFRAFREIMRLMPDKELDLIVSPDAAPPVLPERVDVAGVVPSDLKSIYECEGEKGSVAMGRPSDCLDVIGQDAN